MRAIGLFVLLLVVPGLFAGSLLLGDSLMVTLAALAVWLGLFAAIVLSNAAHYRSYVTPTLVVRRYGLLGRGRKVIPLPAIENVEPDRSRYGSYGESVKLGDLRILDRGGSTFTMSSSRRRRRRQSWKSGTADR
jgi:membrane protein YdbS with pleckstrin-like domain